VFFFKKIFKADGPSVLRPQSVGTDIYYANGLK
jgi:hypothetical protein